MNFSKLLLPATLLLTVNIANAAEDTDLKYGMQASFGVGGDTIVTADIGVTTLDAGDNFSYGIYTIKPNVISDLSGKLALNYIKGSTTFANADEELTRLSVDLLLEKEIANGYSLGAGITYHLNHSYELAYDSGENYTIDFDGAMGVLIEAKKTFKNGFNISLIYTNIEYSGKASEFQTSFASEVDASNVSIGAGFTF